MSAELGKLGLEIGHEKSDAMHDFARDGTISYIHALRYMGNGSHPDPMDIARVCRCDVHPYTHTPSSS